MQIYITELAKEVLEELVEKEKKWSDMIYKSLTGEKESSRKLLHKLALDSINFIDNKKEN